MGLRSCTRVLMCVWHAKCTRGRLCLCCVCFAWVNCVYESCVCTVFRLNICLCQKASLPATKTLNCRPTAPRLFDDVCVRVCGVVYALFIYQADGKLHCHGSQDEEHSAAIVPAYLACFHQDCLRDAAGIASDIGAPKQATIALDSLNKHFGRVKI